MGDYGQTPAEVNFFIHISIVNHYLAWVVSTGINKDTAIII